MPRGGIHGEGLHLTRHVSIGQEGGRHVDPQIIEEVPGPTTNIGRPRIRHEAARDVRLTSAMMLANLGQIDIVVGA